MIGLEKPLGSLPGSGKDPIVTRTVSSGASVTLTDCRSKAELLA